MSCLPVDLTDGPPGAPPGVALLTDEALILSLRSLQALRRPRRLELLLHSRVFSGTIYLFFRDVSFMSLVHNLVWLTEIILLVIALLYRYHSASSPLQRQQTKWVIFGTCYTCTIAVGLRIPTLLFPSLWQTGSFYRLLSGLPIS